MICPAYPDPIFFIFNSETPGLLYYSHLGSMSVTLLIGLFVFLRARNSRAARALLALSISFFAWTFLNLIVWTNNNSETIMFAWSFFMIFYLLICVTTLYFVYVYIDKKDISFGKKLILGTILAPTIIWAPSMLNISSFDLTMCMAVDEGFLYVNYGFIAGFIISLWILFTLVYRYRKAAPEMKKQILALGIGVELFLFSFFITGYLAGAFLENSYDLEFYGLFGMTFFMGVLGYMIVRFKAFNIKLIGAQALVVTLWILIGSLLLVAKSTTTQVIAGITLALALFFGFMLIRSIKREVKQREEIEKLAQNLKRANERLKVLDRMKSEFVSIASHQLRSPLTAIRGYASMLSEGSYGKLPAKAQDVVDRIAESSKYMALSVEDYLNVSRIEAGNMKYEMSDFNLKEVAEKVVDELRAAALKKGLLLLFRSDCNGSCATHGDIGKTRQVIMNLVDNAMKYTPKGTVTVITHDDVKKKKVYVTIHDTGVGMSKETIDEVFEKFVRAKNANCVNVTGTGLGLFVAKKMVVDMGGRVWAESEGEGKGSTFHLEMPLLPGNPMAR